MSKILICPDVHGRKFWHKAKEIIDEVDMVVFLGDYLDPYPHEGITFEDSVEEFKDILNFKEQYSDKVVLLVGNHDMHYIKLDFMNCSRLNVSRRQEMHDLYMNNINKFNLVFLFGSNWLFSHAGVYKDWMAKYEIDLHELFNFKTFIKTRWETLESISYIRGGYDTVGSCIWADIRESVSNELLPNLRHIIGHTQMESKPYITTKVACLDVRQCFILDTETDEIMEFDA